MKRLLFCLVAAAIAAAGRVPSFQWTYWAPETYVINFVVPAADGGVYVGGWAGLNAPRFIARVAPDGNPRWTVVLDDSSPGKPSMGDLHGATTDAAGNLWVAGNVRRSSPVGGIWTVATVAAFAPSGDFIRMHAFGERNSDAQAVAFDSAGSLWVTGTLAGTQTGFGGPTYGFVSRLNAAGEETRVLQMGGERRKCSGGSGCLSAWGYTSLTSIAFGPGGLVAVAGTTGSEGMRVSANAIQTSSGGGVLAVLGSDGKALLETYLGGSPFYIGSISCGSAKVEGLAFDSEGMLYAGGRNNGVRPETTPGVVQASAPNVAGCEGGASLGFLYRINPRTGNVLYSTLLGGESGSVGGVWTEGADAWVAGAAGTSFPVSAGEFGRGPGMMAQIAQDGRSVLQSARLPGGLEGRVVAGGGRVFVFNEHAVSAFDARVQTWPVLFGVANAAGRPLAGRIAPGEVISLYGVGIGPEEPAYAWLDETGRIATELSAVRLFINGKPAPLLYADFEQINAVAPFGATAVDASIELMHETRSVARSGARVEQADPAVFGCRDAEGRVHSAENRAHVGDVLACWVSGLGDMMPRPPDGTIAFDVLPKPVLPVKVTVGEMTVRDVEVLYLGQAPGSPAGVVQLNLRVPPPEFEGYSTATVRMSAGERTATLQLYLAVE